MKIAFILKHFYYYSAQLIEKLAVNNDISLFLDADNREVFQTGDMHARKSSISKLFPGNVHTCFFRSRSRAFEFFAFLRIGFRLRRLRPEIIHVHLSLIRINLYYWVIKKVFCRSCKLILTVHDVRAHPGEASSHVTLSKLSRRLVYDAADKIIVHGEILKKELLDIYPHLKNKIHVLPHGELSIFKRWGNETKTDLLDAEDMVVLCFGRMTPYKDLDTLIEAGKILFKSMDSFRIVIAGAGPQIEKKKHEITKHPCFLCLDGYIPNEMVAYLFSRADIVVLPYLEASQSGVAALAYAFRKPVVATRVGALPEAVLHGKTGFLVPLGDPSKMADAIIRLLTEEGLKQRMRKHIQAWVDRRLSWDRIAQQTMRLYQ